MAELYEEACSLFITFGNDEAEGAPSDEDIADGKLNEELPSCTTSPGSSRLTFYKCPNRCREIVEVEYLKIVNNTTATLIWDL